MDFKDEIKQLGERVEKLKDQIQTEEATKNAFIMPFIRALGYDVFNPLEVIPEYTADVGLKSGEKVDYAVMNEDVPILLIECKKCSDQDLDKHSSQLVRYFHTSKARFGLLTNGIEYRFYSDLNESNIMDEKPFLRFDITRIKDQYTNELKKFHKSYFNIEKILNSASDLKYSDGIKNAMLSELKEPSIEFIKFFISKVYNGRATEKVVSQFKDIIKKSLDLMIRDMVNDRLQNALNKESDVEKDQDIITEEQKVDDKGIITTEEETESFYIIKSILRDTIDLSRIFQRDTKSYFGIILDDSNRQPICRIWLNGTKKYLGVFDENKKERKILIETLEDIYKYSDDIKQSLAHYEIAEKDSSTEDIQQD